MHLAALCFTIAVAAAPSAFAEQQWVILAERSSITFGYTLFGSAATGRFETVRGTGQFRQSAPEQTRFTLEIDVDSLDLGETLVTAYALSAEWFDAVRHPTAKYRLARLRLDEDGLATALGDLTLKGAQVIFETPVALEITERAARATGTIVFDLGDFGIGIGPTAFLVDLRDEVEVRFDLFAVPVADTITREASP